jgi:hypothetical protein
MRRGTGSRRMGMRTTKPCFQNLNSPVFNMSEIMQPVFISGVSTSKDDIHCRFRLKSTGFCTKYTSSRPNCVPPLSPARECCSFPLWVQGGRHTLLRGRGEDPILTKGQTLWYSMYTLFPLRVLHLPGMCGQIKKYILYSFNNASFAALYCTVSADIGDWTQSP